MRSVSDTPIFVLTFSPRRGIICLITNKAEYRLPIFCILRGCSSMAERRLPKPITWVRFPSPAPFFYTARLLITVEIYFAVNEKNRISININIAATINTAAKHAAAACFAAFLPLFLFAEDLLKFSFVRTAFSKSKSCGCGIRFA